MNDAAYFLPECILGATDLGPLSTWTQIDADGPVGMNRQPGMRIYQCTLTIAMLPRPSA